MDMITSIRAPVPIAELPMPAAVEPRPQGALGAAAPVVAPDLPQAVQQVTMKSAANDPQLMATRMTAETSAAAEAARDTYIKASIAAGINPLPVP